MITETQVREALMTVNDPEVGINILDLGLVYAIKVEGSSVQIEITMTSPTCPLGGWIAKEAEGAVRRLVSGSEPNVRLVWSPPWTRDRMSAAARQALK